MMKNYIKSLFELDYTKYPYIIIFIIVFLLSRIPFLNLGFGNDPDAWRIANSAFDLNHYLIYHTSRFPGYPLPEFVNSLVINYGWLATNSLTMIITLISVLVFAKILKELEVENKGLIVITFAFLPIVWINSVNTMDYMWAVTFIIISWYFVIKKRHLIAGLMIGLAIASRPTSAILLIPFIYLIISQNNNKDGLKFLILSLITSFLLFLPLIFQYGLGFISFYLTAMDVNSIINDFLSYFGFLAALVFILILISSGKKAYQTIKNDANLIFAIVEIFLVMILFAISPYETAYLLPAIPFTLYLLSKISNKKLFNLLCILLILNSFVSVNLTLESSELIDKGIVFSDANQRVILTSALEKITSSNINNSIIITGEFFPILSYFANNSSKVLQQNNKEIDPKPKNGVCWDAKRNITYVYIAYPEEIKEWQNKGYKIYFAGPPAYATTKLNFNYDLREHNITNILNQ
ncbi:MAG: hypothetical protein ACC609_06925 [Methanobacterium formicicum]